MADSEVECFEAGRVVFPDGRLEADLVIAVPPHRVPAVMKESGLTGDGDWIRVDPPTLRTAWGPQLLCARGLGWLRLPGGSRQTLKLRCE